MAFMFKWSSESTDTQIYNYGHCSYTEIKNRILTLLNDFPGTRNSLANQGNDMNREALR